MNPSTIYEDYVRMKNECMFVFPQKIKSVNLNATKMINNNELTKESRKQIKAFVEIYWLYIVSAFEYLSQTSSVCVCFCFCIKLSTCFSGF